MNDSLSKLTVIVLVHENHYYLTRCIDYLETFTISAVIVDSSAKCYEKMIPCNASYVHRPGKSFPEKIHDALQLVCNEFVAVLAVDDFFSPQGLKSACHFLKYNDDYVSVAGDSMLVNQYEYGKHIKYLGDGGFSHDIHYDSEYINKRLLQFKPRHYPLFYTVQRKSTSLKVWEFYFRCEQEITTFHHPDAIHFFELLGYLAILLQGKHANLKVFFCLRDLFVYSVGENLKTFNYNSIKQLDGNIYNLIYAIASDVFHIALDEVSDALDEALRSLSEQFKNRGAHPGFGNTYQSLDSNTFSEFTKLTRIIELHRDGINDEVMKKFGKLPKFYEKYGENWVTKIKLILSEKLDSKVKKIVVYGAGEHTQALFDIYDFKNKVVAICDSCQNLWGKEFQGIPIIPAHEILTYSDCVLISSQSAQNEIAKFLNESFTGELSIIKLY